MVKVFCVNGVEAEKLAADVGPVAISEGGEVRHSYCWSGGLVGGVDGRVELNLCKLGLTIQTRYKMNVLKLGPSSEKWQIFQLSNQMCSRLIHFSPHSTCHLQSKLPTLYSHRPSHPITLHLSVLLLALPPPMSPRPHLP